MLNPSLSNIRNISIIAHIDAGKTTLTERLLYYSGKTHRIGEVDEGSTVMDYLDEERSRGITIVAAAASFQWTLRETVHLFHLIDTPGHIDFTAEVERSLRVIDGAVVVFSGVEGVEAQSEKVWRQSDKYKVPKIAFVNKLDRLGASFERVCADIISKFSTVKVVPFHLPVGIENTFNGLIDLVTMRLLHFGGDDGSEVHALEIPAELEEAARKAREKMISAVADLSDPVAEFYLSEKPIPEELFRSEVRKLVMANRLCPVLAGSAKRNIGAQKVLDAVADYLPSPEDRADYTAADPKTGDEIHINVHDKNFCGLIFKLIASGSADLLYLRTYSGRLGSDMTVLNARTKEKLRVKRLLRLYAKNVEPVDEVGPGDIVGIIGLRDATTGDTLCAVNQPVLLEGVAFPDPVISIAIEPKSAKEKDKLESALKLICREDPTLSLKIHESTGQNLLSGMGELHLEVNCNRLRNEFGVEARCSPPQVVYRETIQKGGEYRGVFDRILGDKEMYAEVLFTLEPVPRLPKGLEVSMGVRDRRSTPNAWLSAAEDTMNNGLRTGGNLGYPLMYIRAVVLEVKGSQEKTTESAVAGAVLNGLEQAIAAGTTLLEPVTKVEIMSPEASIGEITGYLQARRAVIQGIDSLPDIKRLICEVPLAEMFGFSKALPKLSGGRASFSMEPCGYQEVSSEDVERMRNGGHLW